MDHVSRTAIEGSIALVGWGEILFFALAIAIVTAILLLSGATKPQHRKHPRPFPRDDEPSSSSSSSSSSSRSASPQLAEISPAAIVGSDYYVPTSDELKGEIKERIIDRQSRTALNLARELVSEYRRRLENDETDGIYCVITNPLADDFTIMRLAVEILRSRGWSASNNSRGSVFFGPSGGEPSCSFLSADLNTIPDSQSFAPLIESRVIAPLKALALSIAKQLVDGYRLKLEVEQPTSPGITVTLAEKIHYNVLTEVENILAPRGWSVTHRDGNSYTVWPDQKRERPCRASRFMLL